MNKFFFRIFLSFLFLFNLNINILSSNNIILDDNSKTWTNVVKEFSYTVALCTVTCATSMIIWHFLEKLLFSKKEDELSTFIKKENKKLNNIETSSNTLIQSPSDNLRYLPQIQNQTEILWKNIFLPYVLKIDLLHYAKTVLTKNLDDIVFPQMLFLYGLPGTNKTNIIKGLANELNVPLVIIDPYLLDENTHYKITIESILEYIKNKGPIIVHIKNIEKMSKNFFISLSKYLKTGISNENVLFTFSCNNDFVIKDLYIHKNKYAKFLIIEKPKLEERELLIKHILSLYDNNVNYYEVDINYISSILNNCKQKDIFLIIEKAIERKKLISNIKKEKKEQMQANFEENENEYFIEEKIHLFNIDIVETYKTFQREEVIINGDEPNQLNTGLISANEFIIENPKIFFNDIIGLEHIKKELKFIVNYLKYPEFYKEVDIRMPKGILFKGTPGCGKTLMAKAIAGEAETTVIVMNGSDFIDKYVGQGAKKIREVFEIAKIYAPTIIFIDEIDAIGCKRSGNSDNGGDKEYTQTINALLVEMDGFDTENNKVIIIASTNRDLNDLDPALLRRFEKKYNFPLPTYQERLKIIEFYFKNTKLNNDVSLENLAYKTNSFSGADLEYLVNQAKSIAVERFHNSKLSLDNFQVSVDDILRAYNIMSIGYEIDSASISIAELYKTAIHESGHTIGMLLQKNYPKHFELVTIIPHDAGNGTVLGFAQNFNKEEFKSYSKEDLKKLIIVSLAGQVAEELIYGHGFDGVSSDLSHASIIARHMVLTYGMSDGLLIFNDDTQHILTTVESEAIEKILHECKEECKALIKKYKQLLEELARKLLSKKILKREEVISIIESFNIKI